jgi:hypothetical protein
MRTGVSQLLRRNASKKDGLHCKAPAKSTLSEDVEMSQESSK